MLAQLYFVSLLNSLLPTSCIAVNVWAWLVRKMRSYHNYAVNALYIKPATHVYLVYMGVNGIPQSIFQEVNITDCITFFVPFVKKQVLEVMGSISGCVILKTWYQ